jgi:hypothetical protein
MRKRDTHRARRHRAWQATMRSSPMALEMALARFSTSSFRSSESSGGGEINETKWEEAR